MKSVVVTIKRMWEKDK